MSKPPGRETAAPMLTVIVTPTGCRSRTASRRRSAMSTASSLRRARQDDEDLLAADPVDRVAGPQLGAHRVSDLLQHRVAGGVAEPGR